MYGASDDLIEIEGDCTDGDEFSGGERAKYFGFTNGTVASIRYDDRGVWAITIHENGDGKIKKLFGLPDEVDETSSQHHGDIDAPSYSDVLIIETSKPISITYTGSKMPKPPSKGLSKAIKIINFLEDYGGFDVFWAEAVDDVRNEILEEIAKICEKDIT